MSSRREFFRNVAGASAGMLLAGRAVTEAAGVLLQPGASPRRRPVTVGGRRVKVVDVHCHVTIPEAAPLLARGRAGAGGAATGGGGGGRGGGGAAANQTIGPERLLAMDAQGIDVEALSINAGWYGITDRELARDAMTLQNEKLSALCKEHPGRFVGFAAVALQFPEMAADQLEEGMKKWGLVGAAIGGSVESEELGASRFDPFWAKAEQLGAMIFCHPQGNPGRPTARLQGNGVLNNVIGNPLETTIALSHLIFEGTFDRFPNLRFCGAHAGGYLPSYAGRMDHGCQVFPEQCTPGLPKKHPSEYVKQIYVDSMVFTSEGLRHLVAEVGIGHVMLGTDYPFPWTSTSVEHVLNTPGLSDQDRIAILGGNACKLLNIPTAI